LSNKAKEEASLHLASMLTIALSVATAAVNQGQAWTSGGEEKKGRHTPQADSDRGWGGEGNCARAQALAATHKPREGEEQKQY